MTKAEYEAKRAKILKAWERAEKAHVRASDEAVKADEARDKACYKACADLDKLEAEYEKGAGE